MQELAATESLKRYKSANVGVVPADLWCDALCDDGNQARLLSVIIQCSLDKLNTATAVLSTVIVTLNVPLDTL